MEQGPASTFNISPSLKSKATGHLVSNSVLAEKLSPLLPIFPLHIFALVLPKYASEISLDAWVTLNQPIFSTLLMFDVRWNCKSFETLSWCSLRSVEKNLLYLQAEVKERQGLSINLLLYPGQTWRWCLCAWRAQAAQRPQEGRPRWRSKDKG